MRLENARGEYLQLKILDYEFPEITDDKWDSNWLVVGLEVKHEKQGMWTASYPCLLTFELEKLISWFENLEEDYSQAKPMLDFMEPNLVFKLLTDKDKPIVRVFFEIELRPEWDPAKSMKTPMEDLWCDFPIAENDLSEAIRSLRTQLEKYPERARQP